ITPGRTGGHAGHRGARCQPADCPGGARRGRVAARPRAMSAQPSPLWLSGAALVAAGGVAIGLGWTGQNAIWATAGVVLVLCGAGVIWQLQRRAGDEASARLD